MVDTLKYDARVVVVLVLENIQIRSGNATQSCVFNSIIENTQPRSCKYASQKRLSSYCRQQDILRNKLKLPFKLIRYASMFNKECWDHSDLLLQYHCTMNTITIVCILGKLYNTIRGIYWKGFSSLPKSYQAKKPSRCLLQ